MSSPVTKLVAELVTPGEQTPCATLPLSSLDHAMGLRFLVEMIAAYGRHGPEEEPPAKAIKGALSKALVPYYPVAGRLVVTGEGELQVACTGDGVWFVEATSRYSLKDLESASLVLLQKFQDIYSLDEVWIRPYKFASNVERPPKTDDKMQSNVSLIIYRKISITSQKHHRLRLHVSWTQVTQLSCGGFVVGVKFNHMVLDGVGASQLLGAVAEIARGAASPVVDPIWLREAIPSPPRLPRDPPTTTFSFVRSQWEFPLESINKIKEEFRREASQGCTTFDVAAAVLWRSRARAIDLDLRADVHLVFPANVRPFLRQLLPPKGGYYGNCVYCLTVTATSEEITRAPLVEIVRSIRGAKACLPAKLAEWAVGDFKDDPFRVPIGYDALNLSDWRSVGFYEVDYGWGPPHCVAPLNDHAFFAGGIILRRPAPDQGVRFVGQVVSEEHEGVFLEEMEKFS
ncbi:hypothetical protein GW17_00018346 [Ensete ventricosum]|nr:hypothetical protein GW17_00018346 [Ensete ventricosum]RZR75761.1 hypothetical protein BHM03_00000247 [Ensete ventricosum]